MLFKQHLRCDYYWCVSLGWAFWFLVKCKAHFSILEGLSFYFISFLKVFLIFVKDFSYFSVARTNFMASVWYWCISLYMDCSVTLRFSKMQVPFLSFWWYHLLLVIFFPFLSFWWYIIYYLSFFSNPFDFFDRLCVITHVTTFLRDFCTVSNALLLLAHYYIDHCKPYALSSIFFKKYIFLKKTDSNAW